jgi:hypothetical protein
MNEELLKRLEQEAEKNTLDMPASLDDKEFTAVFNAELVRLVVQECAKVLDQHAYFSGDCEPYHYAASLIEEHFGIEE